MKYLDVLIPMSPSRFLPQVVFDHLLIQNIPMRFFISNAKDNGAASARNFVKNMWQPTPDKEKSKYVLMSDNDICMPPGSVAAMMKFLDNNEDFAAVGLQRGAAPARPETEAEEAGHISAGPVLYRSNIYKQITYHNNDGCECQGQTNDIRKIQYKKDHPYRIGFLGSWTYDHIENTRRNDIAEQAPQQPEIVIEEISPEEAQEMEAMGEPVIHLQPAEEFPEVPRYENEQDRLNCLQIGIQDFAEYTYLVGCPDKRDADIWKPPDLSPDGNWYYYGVDGDPLCILDWSNKNIPNTNWINVFLAREAGIVNANEINDMLWSSREQLGQNYFVGKITLSQLVKNLNVDNLEILAMDIEGYEFEAFHSYDWSIKPRYLIVETHSEDIKNSLAELFVNNGYKEVEQILRNGDVTTELVYIRND